MGTHRALVVTQYYSPELVGSAPFCADIAERLAQAGWDTTVLTGLPHYPEAEIFPSHRAGANRREAINGVRVERVHVYVPRRRSSLHRIASEAWFLLQGCWALASGRVKKERLVLSLCPSILAVLLGAIARRAGGRHVVVVHDIQSGLAQGLDMVRASWLLRVMRLCEREVLNRADLIVVLTDEMRDHLRQIGVTVAIETLPIWADTIRIQPVVEPPDEAGRLVYSGSFGRKQKLEQIIALAARLQERAPRIEILLRGRGKEFDMVRAQALAAGLRNVQFADLVPPERLFVDESGADIHLVVQNPSATGFALPSKIYNIMAAGLPCLAPTEPGSALARLQQASQGFLCPHSDEPDALADAVLRLAKDKSLRRELGRNGRRFIETNCAKTLVLDRLLTLIDLIPSRALKDRREGMLIFEPEAEGHSYEWLCHLIGHAQSATSSSTVWIVVPPDLYESLARSRYGVSGDRVRLVPLRRPEARLCCHRSLWVSSFARWWIGRRYLARTRAAALHFLALDLLSLPLALGLPLKRCAVSGILFRPSTHYRFLGTYEPNWRERLRDLRKEMLYRLMLNNRSLSAVHTIDPYFARYAARFYRNGTKVQPLADPVYPANEIQVAVSRLAAGIPAERVCFLLFGYLTERKGTLKLLDAMKLLPADIAARTAFMLVGKVDPSIRPAVQQKLEHLGTAQAELFYQLEDRRLASEEIEALLRRADVVLAPYQRFVGSSGVMLWAARFGKPILTQDFGILSSLTRDHHLGMAVDCTNPFVLAGAIARLVAEGPQHFINRDRAREFLADHSPERFAQMVLTSTVAA
jgi:colanic acid biosynthesis glycosyl transferase WcaI